MKHILRIATRKSPLALWQAQSIADQLQAVHPDLQVTLVPMITSGDRFSLTQTKQNNGKGLFVKELEEALLNHHADLAVHSMKDVPPLCPKGLGIVCITQRENPQDAFVSQTYASIQDLPKNATVGTASLRRQAQMLAFRSDLKLEAVRGNVHTRLEKLTQVPFDGIILAAAGLLRLGLQDRIREMISTDVMLPSCGQGAIGIECRIQDESTLALLHPLSDPMTTLCVETERKVNAILGGNCQVPIAIYCTPQEEQLALQAKVLSPDGQKMLYSKAMGTLSQADDLVEQCTQELLAQGARELLQWT